MNLGQIEITKFKVYVKKLKRNKNEMDNSNMDEIMSKMLYVVKLSTFIWSKCPNREGRGYFIFIGLSLAT